jgi:hypothetical protein
MSWAYRNADRCYGAMKPGLPEELRVPALYTGNPYISLTAFLGLQERE